MTAEPKPDPDLEWFAAQRAEAPAQTRPLSQQERDALLELYGVSPLLAPLLKAGRG